MTNTISNVFITMSKRNDKITPEKNEELMKVKIGQIIQHNRKKGFSFFR